MGLATMILLQCSYGLAQSLELSLEDSIVVAYQNNPQVKLAQEDRDTAKWKLTGAKAGFGPSIKFTHTDIDSDAGLTGAKLTSLADYFNMGSSSTEPAYLYIDNDLNAQVPLYTGGKLESQLKQANIDCMIADLEINKIKQQLKLDTIKAYYKVLQQRKELALQQEEVDRLQTHFANTQVKFDQGDINKSDLLRSDVELSKAQRKLMTEQNQLDVALIQFEKQLGLPQTSQVLLKDSLGVTQITLSLDDCIQSARSHRPDLAEERATIQRVGEDITVAKSQNLPQVSLNGDADWNDIHLPGLRNGNWTVSLVASINIFDYGLTKSKIKAAELAVAEAKDQVKQTEDTLVEEVNEAYLDVEEAEKRLQLSQAIVEKAQEDYKITGIRYDEGVGTNLDVMDSQKTLTEVKSDYIQALYDYNVHQAELKKAMGIL
jgi:outer membrane protein TolC